MSVIPDYTIEVIAASYDDMNMIAKALRERGIDCSSGVRTVGVDLEDVQKAINIINNMGFWTADQIGDSS